MKNLINKVSIAFIVFIVFIVLGITIQYYFTPFIYIIILYILAMPIFNFFKKIIPNDNLSGALTLILINLTLFFIIFYLGSELFDIVKEILSKDLTNMDKFKEFILKFLKEGDVSSIDFDIIIKNKDWLQKGAKITTENIVSYVFSNIFVYFLLTDLEYIKESIKVILPKSFSKTFINTINKYKNIIFIEGFLVLITTIEYLLGFIILGIPKSLFLSLLCGILDLLPYVGTIIVFIPLIIYNIILKEYFIAIGLVLLYILAQIIREILETKYVGKNLELHPLLVLLSIYLGLKFLGIIGFVLGPLYVLFLKEINYNTT
ncbi:AI-2E family transporter [Clostridium fallax]|uniref:Predicted PurR-regulated permease PerM n=1 Tax=Clostridium fallax TaxID=1533 RepID=A0A1M4V2J5_9CLOT|nr:AI-2E family transporter [Clostridium fallax]SHE63165.1 Predicted PurR-regulated permease PerM [Clostridium fallax]SQB06581.1 putative permease [Clostridium fallax]